MLRQFNQKPTTSEYTNIRANLEPACVRFLRNRHLPDRSLRYFFNIVANKEAKAADAPPAERADLVLSRQRSVLLLNDTVASRYLARHEAADDKKKAAAETAVMAVHDIRSIERKVAANDEKRRRAEVRAGNQEAKKRRLEAVEAAGGYAR